MSSVRQTSPRSGLVRFAESEIPTRFGSFHIFVYRTSSEDEHLALVRGDPAGADEVLTRIHSECWTGEVLGSLRCDCREQLDRALAQIDREGCGVLVYLRQEGRGIGLGNKIRAYALQDDGADTVEANRRLGFPGDARRYDVAADILHEIGVRSVRLLTNNPDKVEGLLAAGVTIVDRLPLQVEPNDTNAAYLETKRDRLGHIL